MVEKDAVRRGYDGLAEAYAADRSEDGLGTEVLAQFLGDLPESAHVLDAGCGQGTPVLRDLTASATATGVDISRAQLELAAESVPDAALAQGDMAALPFRDGVFDAAIAYHSLIHVPKGHHQDVVDEFARVLTDDGRLLVSEGPTEWSGANPDWLDTGVEMQWHIAGVAATRDHLRNAGFVVEREWNTPESVDKEDERWVFLSARVADDD
ncbi:ubiquinone/menaquinone biosynthesis C-methylase UbiE [Halorubrum alkaliphilum]|uniref:Ubiquinone/menaquinone biosynthesis C-methylase UbiE n=1 Tax=Halorubrum alkaliphilum TaxID=261290 RepID=A0A8T4GDR6_9EURY|nr:class I SAM-dependent methyltransferase [Halorubrum alkaliphilum]MBP1921382.1 ubiquinone/menaquinone biosynthesis C-methylase UbiE [Halorubrum alkaliphilum]